MKLRHLLFACGLSLAAGTVLPVPAAAQVAAPAPSAQSLADIRIEIETLARDLQSLRAELVTNNPAVTGVENPAPVLARIDQIEEELRRLTGQTEELRFRIDRIVTDGTNRIGDLEFRLLELEGGDYSSLGETRPLGEGAPAASQAPAATSTDTTGEARPIAPPTGDTRPIRRPSGLQPGAPIVSDGVAAAPLESAPLARPSGDLGLQVGSADPAVAPAPLPPAVQPADTGALSADEMFTAAFASFTSGDYPGAEQGFTRYLETYPAAPRIGEATFWRGEALAAQNNWNAAARNYLDSFSGAPNGPKAADALYRLGVALGRLGQTNEACLTLGQVTERFPSLPADLAARTASEQRALGCS